MSRPAKRPVDPERVFCVTYRRRDGNYIRRFFVVAHTAHRFKARLAGYGITDAKIRVTETPGWRAVR